MLSSYGAITSVEAPTLDSYVMAQLEQKGLMNDHYTKARQARKEQEYRHAQNILKDSMEANRRAEALLTETWGKEKANEMVNAQSDKASNYTKFDMLDGEKLNSFMRIIT